ncbi:unnamed protein product [Calypogeia fissa]
MTRVLPSPVAAGVFKDQEKALLQRGPVYVWPNPVMSRVQRLSYLCVSHRLHHGGSNNRTGAHQHLGRYMLKKRFSSSRSHGCHLIPDLSKHILSGWPKSRHKPCLYPSVILSRTSVRRREAFVVTSESGEDTEMEDSDDSDTEVDHATVIQETLTMFEWPAICAQVAQYACTPMGMSIAEEGNLTIGANKAQSQDLLQQTADALTLSEPLNFFGIEDLQSLLAEAMSGSVCEINELCSIKNTLIGIRSVHNQLNDPTGANSDSLTSKLSTRSSLQALMFDSDLCSDLVSDIDYCLDCTRTTVLDRASPGLAAARQSRQENMRALEVLLKETAAWVVQQGGMDSVVVTRRRSRLCIAVRSSHKSLLPGGIVLDVSNTGTTSFMEPEPALRLNNEETRLAGAERAEEIAVLKSLTLKLVDKADAIMDLLGRITVLDLACARASHARWLGSVCPSFRNQVESQCSGTLTQAEDFNPLLLDILGMRHPLLLGSVLPILSVSQRCGIVQSSTSPQFSRSEPQVANSSDVPETRKLPVPIDIKVKTQVRVVTITGPNTGGKTATLKACGVAAVMAKAGLFLPAVGQPKLPWFDMVLADIGDSQSLEQSLSTFSGHVRRISSILELCSDQSFILLDEIGGGTDPSEGAALAIAVLRHLASKVWLTIATTHSAELKTLRDQDPRFENASVEFDLVTLKPTYRVLWGVAGQSNALDIAASLGFDSDILTRARELVGQLRPSQLGTRTAEVLVPLLKQRDEMLERSRTAAEVLSKARDLHQELKAATDDLPKREASRKKSEERAVQSDIESARLRMDEVIERFDLAMAQGVNNSSPSAREVHAEISSIVEEYKLKEESTTILELFSREKESLDRQKSGPEAFAVGEKVIVRKLGKSPVTIMELPQKDSDFLTVQLGTLKMQVKPSEVVKITKSRFGSGSDPTPAKADKISYKARRPTKNQTSEVESAEPKYQVAVQTSKNTLDLRGMRVEDALRELNMTLASKGPLSVLFIVHGVGTGAVKEAVLQTLRQHRYVAKFEGESITNAGCTIVYIK